jgi:hypothetical protein
MRVETRFVGTGNTWIGNGHYRGWRVTCARCDAVKTITSHNGSSMPPELIVKMLAKSGWHLGRTSEEDLCAGCRKKPKPVIKPAVKTMTSPTFYFEQLRMCLSLAKKKLDAKQYYFVASYLDDALRQLDPAMTKELMLAMTPPEPVKQAAPVKEAAPVKQAAPVGETDNDYRQWLAQLSKEDQA